MKYQVHVRGADVPDRKERKAYISDWIEVATFMSDIEADDSQYLSAPHATVRVDAKSVMEAMAKVVPPFDVLRPVSHITVRLWAEVG